MAEERLRCALPLPVALYEGFERAHQLAAVGALGLLDRGQDRVAEEPQRVVVLQRQQQLEGAEVAVGGERRGAVAVAVGRQRPRLERAARLVEAAPQLAGRDRAPGARGQRLAADPRHARVQALGEREQLVVVERRQQRAQEAPGRRDEPAAGLLAHGARSAPPRPPRGPAATGRAPARRPARAGRTAPAGAPGPAPRGRRTRARSSRRPPAGARCRRRRAGAAARARRS